MSARAFRVSRRDVTAIFRLRPGSLSQGRVTLDVDPGIGPMTYQDHVTRWTIVSGDRDDLRAVAADARNCSRYLTPGGPGQGQLLSWAEAVERIAAVTSCT